MLQNACEVFVFRYIQVSAALGKGRVQYWVVADGHADFLPAVAARQGGEDALRHIALAE